MKRYKDALGNWRQTPADTYAAIVDTMSQEIAAKDAPLLVVRRGQRKRLKAPAEIILEDGVLSATATLPRDLPLGYHRLRYLDGDRNICLIVTPGKCFLPKALRVWGPVSAALCPALFTKLGHGRLCQPPSSCALVRSTIRRPVYF
jgi:hypothetical protein